MKIIQAMTEHTNFDKFGKNAKLGKKKFASSILWHVQLDMKLHFVKIGTVSFIYTTSYKICINIRNARGPYSWGEVDKTPRFF